jgi:hypothetical protein
MLIKVYTGIDASLTSTALCIESDGHEILYNFHTGKQTKWFKLLEPVVKFHNISHEIAGEYSESEVSKHKSYQVLSDKIRYYLSPDSLIGIEGYSYSSQAGPLIDLVTFGTLLRQKIINITEHLTIYAPTNLKASVCKIAYGTDQKGIARNDEGIAGGKFTKREMLKAMFDHAPDAPMSKILIHYKDDLLKMKNIPKPIDDLVDAWWCKEVVRLSQA